MNAGSRDGTALSEETLSRLRTCLSAHPVSFAMLFGSVAREEATERSDIDVAVAFESLRPEDDGYSDVYLRLRSDLDDLLPTDVDVVDVRSMSPSFARAVFDTGEVVLGSDEQRDRFEHEVAGRQSSTADARDRVAAAAERLRENTDPNRGTVRE